ncbi:hypothetical protein OUZ56_027551 [Daphnia magna]|uniref:Uncharacterized protein n=1 Tax=Daphnia magna TaxID=35525 RepID=A0ABQ9ZQ35_9CRUS|nr:hypothetical protein OUZ56_027551 [Daphnia magna]
MAPMRETELLRDRQHCGDVARAALRVEELLPHIADHALPPVGPSLSSSAPQLLGFSPHAILKPCTPPVTFMSHTVAPRNWLHHHRAVLCEDRGRAGQYLGRGHAVRQRPVERHVLRVDRGFDPGVTGSIGVLTSDTSPEASRSIAVSGSTKVPLWV